MLYISSTRRSCRRISTFQGSFLCLGTAQPLTPLAPAPSYHETWGDSSPRGDSERHHAGFHENRHRRRSVSGFGNGARGGEADHAISENDASGWGRDRRSHGISCAPRASWRGVAAAPGFLRHYCVFRSTLSFVFAAPP